MREEDVVKTLKHLKQIKASSAFRHTLRQSLERQSIKQSIGMPSFKVIGLTLALAAFAIVLSARYLNTGSPYSSTGAAPVGQAVVSSPTPPPPPTPMPPPPPPLPPFEPRPNIEPPPFLREIPPPRNQQPQALSMTQQLDYSIILEAIDPIPTPPPYDPADPLADMWQRSPLPEGMLTQNQPFPILYPASLPEGFDLDETNLIETKFQGNGVELIYRPGSSAHYVSLTQFVSDTEYGLTLDPETTTLYEVGDSDAACYPLDNASNVFAWSRGNYILEMFSTLSCEELYDIAVAVQ